MEIEKVNENKIKITLSVKDLEDMNIDFDSIVCDSPKAQEFFWDMISEIEAKYELGLKDSHFFIEAKTGKNDNLIILVTKVDNSIFEESDFFDIKPLKAKQKNRKKKNPKLVKIEKNKIYMFKNFDTVCSLVKNIKNLYKGASTLYKYNDNYYMVSNFEKVSAERKDFLEIKFNEYGKNIPNVNTTLGILEEYGTKVMDKNALKVIKKYFV